MADEFLSDRDSEEALREWWRENWRWIFGGVVLGIGLLVGWHYRGVHVGRQSEEASRLYGEVQAALTTRDVVKAQEALGRLVAGFDDSGYAQQGRLAIAKVHVEAGEFADAEALLRTVAARSEDKQLANVAQLRLARLLIQQGKQDDALKLLEPLTAGGFGAQAREIRGDALFAKGDVDGARAEYAAALANADGQIDRSLVELKLQDVGGSTPAASQGGIELPSQGQP